jgi:septum formation protein
MNIYLASSSPRRHEILMAMGIKFTAAGVDIDESRYDGESASGMVIRLAIAKASAARMMVTQSVPVIGADTAVALEDQVLGKPESEDEAMEMLASLSGREHKVLTGVALDYLGEITTTMSITEVRFREIHPNEASIYWQSREPCDKAGAYAIQGIGGIFVEYISGSYSGVVGLPIFETAELLNNADLCILSRKSDRLHD